MSQANMDVPAGSGAERFTSFEDDAPSIEELAAQQGVSPVSNLEELRVDFWPESDGLDEFSATIRRWRREGSR